MNTSTGYAVDWKWLIRHFRSYGALNFELPGSSTFHDFPKSSICDDEVGDGNDGLNAISSQPDMVDDVISGGM